MVKTHKEKMLEARITRLENLLNTKNEGRLLDYDAIMQEMMDDLWRGDGMDYDEWIETLEAGAAGELDDTVEWYADEYGLPEPKVRGMLTRVAKQCLKDIENGDPTPFDNDDDDDEAWESCNRHTKRRSNRR